MSMDSNHSPRQSLLLASLLMASLCTACVASTSGDGDVSQDTVQDTSPDVSVDMAQDSMPDVGDCGNGSIQTGEACDDNNTLADDGCSSTCSVESGWNCQGAPSTCSTTCGDSIRAGNEVCDGPDVTATCQSEGLGNGTITCTNTCTLDTNMCVPCGDGVCDDARSESIDSCAEDCGFVDLSVGSYFTCAVRSDGAVWCWGENDTAQLGGGSVSPFEATPAQVMGLPPVLQIDVADRHACALAEDAVGVRSVWCWGGNGRRQAAAPMGPLQTTPLEVVGIPGTIVQVDVGWRLSCALTEDGSTYCWGNNNWSDMDTSWSLGNCGFTDEITATPTLADVTNATAISADGSTVCALTRDALMCWGANMGGERGNGGTVEECPATAVAFDLAVDKFVMGDHYGIALDANGDAWGWGFNDSGQLGDDSNMNQRTPIELPLPPLASVGLGWEHTCATSLDGAAACWGLNNSGQIGFGFVDADIHGPTMVMGLDSGVRYAGAGKIHSCALLLDGHVMCWGDNSVGQLGTGGQSSAVPVLTL